MLTGTVPLHGLPQMDLLLDYLLNFSAKSSTAIQIGFRLSICAVRALHCCCF